MIGKWNVWFYEEWVLVWFYQWCGWRCYMLFTEWYNCNDTVQALCTTCTSMNMRTINVNIASDDIDYRSEANYNYNSISCGGSDNLLKELMNDNNIAGCGL